ncbi:hypothetical protein [Rhodovulum sp. FJ3]|uniref:hypothetical protein n=1 Tax=Rhodovulum sp. FJ3 TaxID=3079053 RepID=UPI00293DED50|nr:hypothetical protein [Rhodovulum sp. FJ3]MDV4166758.1 hypothetical protein [Rhodovulum sp. FJ3]
MLGFAINTTTRAVRQGIPKMSLGALAPQAWFDPSDATTLFSDTAMSVAVTADGQQVAAMLDKSGSGNHLLQDTAAARPIYRTDGVSSWLEFDGADDMFTLASRFGLAANPALTACVALRASAESSIDTVWHIGGSSGILEGAGGTSGLSWRYGGGNKLYSALGVDTTAVLSWRREALSTYGEGELRKNGFGMTAQSTANSNGTPTNTEAFFSLMSASGNNYFSGRLYGFALFDRSLTDPEIAQVESYLTQKAGGVS